MEKNIYPRTVVSVSNHYKNPTKRVCWSSTKRTSSFIHSMQFVLVII